MPRRMSWNFSALFHFYLKLFIFVWFCTSSIESCHVVEEDLPEEAAVLHLHHSRSSANKRHLLPRPQQLLLPLLCNNKVSGDKSCRCIMFPFLSHDFNSFRIFQAAVAAWCPALWARLLKEWLSELGLRLHTVLLVPLQTLLAVMIKLHRNKNSSSRHHLHNSQNKARYISLQLRPLHWGSSHGCLTDNNFLLPLLPRFSAVSTKRTSWIAFKQITTAQVHASSISKPCKLAKWTLSNTTKLSQWLAKCYY